MRKMCISKIAFRASARQFIMGKGMVQQCYSPSRGYSRDKCGHQRKCIIFKSTVLVACPPITVYPFIPNQYELISGLMDDIDTLMMQSPHINCLRVSTGVKRCHDSGNSYKGKHLIRGGLRFQRFSLLSWSNMAACWQTWYQRGSQVPYILTCRQQEVFLETDSILSIYKISKSASKVTYLLQQGHTYSKEATPPNSTTLFGNILLQTTTLSTGSIL